ncbi:MAG: hypothetical protein R6X10_03190 [Desulfobacterales bacterium]
MNLKPVRIELTPSEIQKVLSIVLDEDKDEVLELIQALAKRLEKALAPS